MNPMKKNILQIFLIGILNLILITPGWGNLPDPVKKFFYEQEFEKQAEYYEDLKNHTLSLP